MMQTWLIMCFQWLSVVFASTSFIPPLGRQVSRGPSEGELSTYSDSPLTLPPSTPKSISLALLTKRDEDLAVWRVLFSFPEYVRGLFDEFVKFKDDVEDETLLWPKLAIVAALKTLNGDYEGLVDEVITPHLLSLHGIVPCTSDESILDVFETILQSLPDSLKAKFSFPDSGTHLFKTVILQDQNGQDILLDFCAYLNRQSFATEDLPAIMSFGIKRLAETPQEQLPINLPTFLHVGSSVYERIAGIFHSTPDGPFACWIKNFGTGELELASFRQLDVSETHFAERDDIKTVLAFYRLQTTTEVNLEVPEGLLDYARKQVSLPENPLELAVLDAESEPLLGALLTCFLGDEGLIEAFEKTGATQSTVIIDFYRKILRGDAVNLQQTEFLHLIQERVPSELTSSLHDLWVQLCGFVFPIDFGMDVEHGLMVGGEMVYNKIGSFKGIPLTSNDHLGLLEGHLVANYQDHFTLILPRGRLFGVTIARIPQQAVHFDSHQLNNDLARFVAFVSVDSMGVICTYFSHGADWIRYESSIPLTRLQHSPETEALIREELETKSVFILFRHLLNE